MADQGSSLFLTRLTHDARLEIYSHLILPPFDGCQTSTGLFLACRQLQRELDQEGVRQLRIFLDGVGKAEPRRQYSRSSAKEEAEVQEEVGRFGYLSFARPTTVSKTVPIRVKVPFILPKISYHWHHQRHLSSRRAMGCTPPQLNELQREHERQQEVYKAQVTYLLEPLRELHLLHAPSLEIDLVADEATRERIAKDSELFEVDRYFHFFGGPSVRPAALNDTILGLLLTYYVQTLGDNAGYTMMDTSSDWAFNTTTVKVAWDFGPDSTDVSAKDLHRYSCGNFFIFNSGFGQALCTSDRLRGTVQINYDVVRFVRRQVSKLKERVRSARAREPGYMMVNISEEERKLARQESKLRKLGILDVEPVAQQMGRLTGELQERED